jgi:hypothetical protein
MAFCMKKRSNEGAVRQFDVRNRGVRLWWSRVPFGESGIELDETNAEDGCLAKRFLASDAH